MKHRLLPLALAALGAIAAGSPAAAQKSHSGKANYASNYAGGSKGLSIQKPYHSSGGHSSHSGHPSFGVSISKPGFSLSIGNHHSSLSVYKPVCAPAPVWHPGHWTSVREQVWIPACSNQVWVPAQYATHYDPCGKPYQVMVDSGHYQTVHTPGHYEIQLVQKWIPGSWSN